MLSELIVDFINNMEKNPPKRVFVAEASSLKTSEPRTYCSLFTDSPSGRLRAWAIAFSKNIHRVDVRGNVSPEVSQFTVGVLKFGQRYLAQREIVDPSYSGHETRVPVIMDVKHHGIDDAAALDY